MSVTEYPLKAIALVLQRCYKDHVITVTLQRAPLSQEHPIS